MQMVTEQKQNYLGNQEKFVLSKTQHVILTYYIRDQTLVQDECAL